MVEKRVKHRHYFLFNVLIPCISLSIVWLFTSCGSNETQNEPILKFETIEQNDWPAEGYSVGRPGLMVITQQEDIGHWQGLDVIVRELQEIDYEKSFVLSVFQGRQETSGYKVKIERITRDGTTITIYAQFQSPKLIEEKVDLVASPYQMVEVQKNWEWDQEYLFQLIVDGSVIATQSSIHSPNETTLNFESIEQDVYRSGYDEGNPGIMVIKSRKDIPNWKGGSDEAIKKLQELDFENYFALIIFQGQKPNGGYEVEVKDVTKAGTTISIYAQFRVPKADEASTATITSPFHLIQVHKTWDWDQEFLFRLIVNGMIAATLPKTETPYENKLSFETIEQRDSTGPGRYYEAIEPGITIITRKPDADYWDGWISDSAIRKLRKLGYKNSFALIVFQGLKPTDGYEVEIVRVTKSGNTISIYTQFHEPKPDELREEKITSPYHLVQVLKTWVWNKDFLFRLIVDNTLVASLHVDSSKIQDFAYPPPPITPTALPPTYPSP